MSRNGGVLVARHARSFEPHARVIDPRHYDGLWRRPTSAPSAPSAAPEPSGCLAAYGRSLRDYEAALGAEVSS